MKISVCRTYSKLAKTAYKSVGYIFITLAFIGQLVCSYFALKAESLQKMFYNIPLITISYTGLIVMLIVGALAMAIPNLPNWVGIVMILRGFLHMMNFRNTIKPFMGIL